MKMKKRVFQIFSLAAGALLLTFAAGCGRNRSADSLLERAHREAAEGKWEKALALSGEALAREPENVSALLLRAIAGERCGERDQALNFALQAVRINPRSFLAQYTLGRLYAADPARLSDAAKPLLEALELKPDDRSTLVLLANVAIELNNERALNYLLELGKDPAVAESAVYWNQLAVCYLRRNDINRAWPAMMQAYQKGETSPRIVLNTAIFVDVHLKRPSQAAAFYRQFQKLTAGNADFAALRESVAARLSRISR